MGPPIVHVNVQASEIAHHSEIQITITIEIHKRRAVASAPSPESRCSRGICKMSRPIVQEQVGWMAVIGVEVGRWHLAALVRDFVLAQPDIKIAIAIDISAREYLPILEFWIRRPNAHSRIVERPERRAFEEK